MASTSRTGSCVGGDDAYGRHDLEMDEITNTDECKHFTLDFFY